MDIKFSLRVDLFSNFKLLIFYHNFQHKMPFYDWLEIVLRRFISGWKRLLRPPVFSLWLRDMVKESDQCPCRCSVQAILLCALVSLGVAHLYDHNGDFKTLKITHFRKSYLLPRCPCCGVLVLGMHSQGCVCTRCLLYAPGLTLQCSSYYQMDKITTLILSLRSLSWFIICW